MEVAGKLRELGHEVLQFSEYHFRVDEVFDYWLPRGKWWDRVTGERESIRFRKPLDQLAFFIHERLVNPPTEVTEKLFVHRLVEIGWTEKEAKQSWKERQSLAASSGR